jgi:hypothetical protein
VLTNASGAGKETASARSAPATYRVESTSAVDLKTHLGRKVRLTGVLARSGESSSDVTVRRQPATSQPMPGAETAVKDQATTTSAPDIETSPTLRVTSVEQVADTCDSSRHP